MTKIHFNPSTLKAAYLATEQKAILDFTASPVSCALCYQAGKATPRYVCVKLSNFSVRTACVHRPYPRWHYKFVSLAVNGSYILWQTAVDENCCWIGEGAAQATLRNYIWTGYLTYCTGDYDTVNYTSLHITLTASGDWEIGNFKWLIEAYLYRDGFPVWTLFTDEFFPTSGCLGIGPTTVISTEDNSPMQSCPFTGTATYEIIDPAA